MRSDAFPKEMQSARKSTNSSSISSTTGSTNPSSASYSLFVSKIGEIVLRNRITTSRTRTKSDISQKQQGILSDISQKQQGILHSRIHSDPGLACASASLLGLHLDSCFWLHGVALHLDIFSNSGYTLERWVLSFSSFYSPPKTERDDTDLILLLQCLYAHIRHLPLGVAVADGAISQSNLCYSISFANGDAVDHSSSVISRQQRESRQGFHPNAPLSVYKFKSAESSSGILHLKVLYDTDLLGNSLDDHCALSYLRKLSKIGKKNHTPESGSIIIGGGSFVDDALDESNRPSRLLSSSPFPSPRQKKKVLSFAHLKVSSEYQERREGDKTLSNLYISSSNDDLKKDGNSKLGFEVSQDENRLDKTCGSLDTTSRVSISCELFGRFVGSYEESILIGRLSTMPSKPLPFIAEIGVLATGKAKPRLKCPPHISHSFSAYFYQLPDEDSPTPYVGTIDLGVYGYRLPTKGQLQIMIKNPSCTAIKVFLIPYDFQRMPANSKTFLRQKSYAKNVKLRTQERLKFAIQLNFLMTSKHHLYLSSLLRIVFSPRPLENDEKLKIVYQSPSFPKYSPVCEAKKEVDISSLSWLEASPMTLQDQGR